MGKIQDFVKELIKKKEALKSDKDDNNYIDIALGLGHEGKVYCNFYKEGEPKKYEELPREDRALIIKTMIQSSTVFARIENQASQNKKYVS